MRVANALRGPILAASRNRALRAFAVRHGVRFGAGRFVAGTTLDEFVAVARAQNGLGRRVAAGYLGEGVTDAADADRIASDFAGIVDRIRAERLDATVAVKLSHLGLDVAEERALTNARAVAAHAARNGIFVRIDMEESQRVPATLRIYRELRAAGYDNVGIVLQAALRRSAGDLDELGALAANVRLVKGAYREPAAIAYTSRADIDRNYARLIERALRTLPFTAIAHPRRGDRRGCDRGGAGANCDRPVRVSDAARRAIGTGRGPRPPGSSRARLGAVRRGLVPVPDAPHGRKPGEPRADRAQLAFQRTTKMTAVAASSAQNSRRIERSGTRCAIATPAETVNRPPAASARPVGQTTSPAAA